MSLIANKPKSLAIPISIFRDRELSVLEAIAEYLKDKKGMRYSEIAQLLNRDDRTIWTSYKRAKEKRKSSQEPLAEQKEKMGKETGEEAGELGEE